MLALHYDLYNFRALFRSCAVLVVLAICFSNLWTLNCLAETDQESLLRVDGTRRNITRTRFRHLLTCNPSSHSPCAPLLDVDLVLDFGSVTLLNRVAGNLLVIALESRKVFTSLRELAFLHALTDVPVDECTLGVHEIELM